MRPPDRGDRSDIASGRSWSGLSGEIYPVFDRIALHLLRLHADSVPDLVTERLTRKDLYDSSKHRHEYTFCFKTASPASSRPIVNAFWAGSRKVRTSNASPPTTNLGPGNVRPQRRSERYADHYRLERLWPIRDDLPEPGGKGSQSLVARLGEPEHPDFLHYYRSESSTIEDRSPKTIDDLRGMSVEHIASFVRNWQPTDEFRARRMRDSSMS